MDENEFLRKHALMKQTAVKSIFEHFLSDYSIDSHLANHCYRILQEVSVDRLSEEAWFTLSQPDHLLPLDLRRRLCTHPVQPIHSSSPDGTDSRTVMRSFRAKFDLYASDIIQSLLGDTEVFPQTTFHRLRNDGFLHATENSSFDLAKSTAYPSTRFGLMFWLEFGDEQWNHLWNISVRTMKLSWQHLIRFSRRSAAVILSRNQRNTTIHSIFAIIFQI